MKKINKTFSENMDNGVPQSFDIVRPEVWPERENERIKELISGIAGIAGDAVKMFGEVNERFFYAPAVIYLCMDKRLTSWSMFDLGAISQSIMLAAAERGLATMPAVELVHYPGVLRSCLDIPDSLSVVFGIAIGYEDSLHPINKFKSTRRPVSDVARFSGVK